MSEKKDDEEKKDERCFPVESKNKEGSICVVEERCKGCEFCIQFCPVGALETSDDVTEKGYRPPEVTGDCILCGKCEKICPEFSIYLKEKDEDEERGDWI